MNRTAREEWSFTIWTAAPGLRSPILRFQWKVGNVVARSDPTTKAGDDYAARIYVTFAYDPARATVREPRLRTVLPALFYGETPPHQLVVRVHP